MNKKIFGIILSINALMHFTLSSTNVDINEQLIEDVKKGDIANVKNLVGKGANVNFIDEFNCTPLIYAIKSNSIRMLQTLINMGANANLLDTGYTPLHFIAVRDNSKSDVDIKLTKLLIKGQANINLQTLSGLTALYLAVSMNKLELVRLLTKNGAEANIEKGNNTCLRMAITNNNNEVVKILINSGANVNWFSNNTDDTPNYSILHFAVKEGCLECIKMLINAGANINIKNDFDQTPLHLAIKDNKKNIVKILTDAGADINIKTYAGLTPLKYFLYGDRKDKEILEILVKAGAYINTDHINEFMPLHHCIYPLKNKEYVAILLQTCKNLHGKDEDGLTPLQLAKKRGLSAIYNLLKQKGANY